MVANPVHWTIHDLDAMPDDGGWKRYEIIEGELLVTRAPHFSHQSTANKISSQLEVWSQRTGLGSPCQTPGVIFTEVDAVIPDVVWASKARLAHGMDEAGHFTVAPELMVEILSEGEANQQRDKRLKLKLYSLHGVQEYWIVNWRLKELEVYRREDVTLKKVATFTVKDRLTSPLLPEFDCVIASLFPA